MPASEINQLLVAAVEQHTKGMYSKAASLYQQVLRKHPQNPDALHLLGLIQLEAGNTDSAIQLIEAAIGHAREPNSVFFGNYGIALRRAERVEDALVAYQQSLSIEPSEAEVRFNYGKALKHLGRGKEAEEQFGVACKIRPTYVSPWLSLMNLAMEAHEYSKAQQIGETALKNAGENPQIWKNLGVVARRRRDLESAIGCLQRAIHLDSNDHESFAKLSSVFLQLRNFVKAAEALESAKRIAPGDPSVLVAEGSLLHGSGQYERAQKVLEKAILDFPDNGTLAANLGIAHKKLGRLEEAKFELTRAIKLDPTSLDSYSNLAGVELSLGNFEAARGLFEKVIKLRGGDKDAYDGLLMAMQYDPSVSQKEILEKHRGWPGPKQLLQTSVFARHEDSTKNHDAPIRIGFCSADLGNHPVGFFLYNLFRFLDKSRYETYVYSDRIGEDDLRDKLKRLVVKWIDTAGESDAELLQRIRSHQIDVLFDLSGHTAYNRLPVFAARAAPVQVSWAGYVGTTGVTNMDYVLGDKYHIPSKSENEFTEKILRLPNCYVTYRPPDCVKDLRESRLPALDNGFITFIAACNPAKVNPSVLSVWSEILQRLPGSRLNLVYEGWTDSLNKNRVEKVLGSAIERVDFRTAPSTEELMRFYSKADLTLDTFPYSGGLTTCESLWCGVPVITYPSDRFCGRHSSSYLHNIGLNQFVAKSTEKYIDIAVSTSNDIQELIKTRNSLRSIFKKSAIYDGPRFANDFTALIDQLVTRSNRRTLV